MKQSFERSINRFAFRLLEEFKEENLFFSPYSIYTALCMLTIGAKRETKEELEKVLEIFNLEQINKEMKNFILYIENKEIEVKTANSVWFSNSILLNETIEQDFFNPLVSYYKAKLFKVDFTKAEIVSYINKWISKKTEGMIDPFLDVISEKTKMAILNAIYFNGEWFSKFELSETTKQEFYGIKQVNIINMMHQSNKRFQYIEKNNIRAIEFPYKDKDIVMDILISAKKEKETVQNLFYNLTIEQREEFLNELDNVKKEKISLFALPKFQFESPLFDLYSILKKMGIKHAFSIEEANFSLIAKKLYINSVLHKAKIEVEESGSKAAAATVEFARGSYIQESGIKFIVNEPFLFLIRDKKTKVILFIGKISQL